MNFLKSLVIYLLVFFGLYFFLSFMGSIIFDMSFKAAYGNRNWFTFYLFFIGWWIGALAIPKKLLVDL